MSALDLRRCHFVLDNLVRVRAPHIQRLPSAALHLTQLTALRDEVEAALDRPDRKPRDGLRALMAEHVELTSVLSTYLAAHRRDPLASDAERAAAAHLEGRVVEGRRGPTHSANQRAIFAVQVARQRANLEDDLANLPPRLGALLTRWIEVGEALGDTASARTLRDQPEARSPQDLVRATWRALSRLRRSVRVALELDPTLPDALERLILGYADELSTRSRSTTAESRLGSVAPETAAPEPAAPEPADAEPAATAAAVDHQGPCSAPLRSAAPRPDDDACPQARGLARQRRPLLHLVGEAALEAGGAARSSVAELAKLQPESARPRSRRRSADEDGGAALAPGATSDRARAPRWRARGG